MLHVGTVALLAVAGLGLDVGLLYWLGVVAVAALLAYEHSLVRPGDLRRLDAAFFTVNGVISIVFFAFVARRRAPVIARAGAREALRARGVRCGRSTSSSSAAASSSSPGANGSGKTTLLRLVAGLAAPTGGELEVDADRGELGFLGHEPLLYRELTALENLDLYGRLYRVPGAARADRHAARALRPLGRRAPSASRRTRAG